MVWTRLLGGVAVALVSGIVSVHAAMISVDLDGPPPGRFGRLDQDTVDACKDAKKNSLACGPTAAVNSFVYLQNAFPDVYGTKLVVDDPTLPGNAMQDTAVLLSGNGFMKCAACEGGTKIGDFIDGKQKWIESKAPGRTVYKHQDVFGLGDRGMSKSHGTPTFEFLLKELRHGEDIEILISYHDDKDFQDDTGDNDKALDDDTDKEFYGGHFLTITGLSLNDANNNGSPDAGEAFSLMFIDPDTGAPGSAMATLGGLFGFDTDYCNGCAGGVITGASISAIVTESVPEPETIALFVVGLLGLAGFKARRRA